MKLLAEYLMPSILAFLMIAGFFQGLNELSTTQAAVYAAIK